MENTVGAGDNYWQVTDDRPETSGTAEDMSEYYDTLKEAEEALDALPGKGTLYATHDDGRSDQFDWQVEKTKKV